MNNFLCLDDTGSTHLSLFSDDDLVGLGIDGAYTGWGPRVNVQTANGLVECDSLRLLLGLKDNGEVLMRPLRGYWCLAIPGSSAGQMRLSGMSVRGRFYTATAPDGSGSLYVSVKRNGVVGQLPVV